MNEQVFLSWMKRRASHVLLVFGLLLMSAEAVESELPGERDTRAPVSFAPFPDRMSAYVWRNWPVVPVERLAETVGATIRDLERIAAELSLPVPQPAVSPAWHRKGYITIVRRNWHLLPYEQLMRLVGMDRAQFGYCLAEDDFLFCKLGNVKPLCESLRWNGAELAATRARRERLASWLKEEGAADYSEEPRFAFVEELSRLPAAAGGTSVSAGRDSPFDLRLIFSYFADYGDPLIDDAVGSYPEGLLARLASYGVNAVYLHTVLSTLAKDPKYPEFGKGSERRIANLRKLVARAGKYGIKVYLYLNEPRAQGEAFFAVGNRASLRGCRRTHDGVGYAMCTSVPEVRRYLRDAIAQVFSSVKGLGGVFAITMSENLTNCASRYQKDACERCRHRTVEDIVAEVNRTIWEGVKAGDPDAEMIAWDWGWENRNILPKLPEGSCRVMTVSERGVPIAPGGHRAEIGEYALSAPGPSDRAVRRWRSARARGMKTMAKIQAALTWEIASVPYVPVMDLVAEHACNLLENGVDGVMLSWSLGCSPSPNLALFADCRRGEGVTPALDRLAERLYGAAGAPLARRAWTAYSNGFREYPFHISGVYCGNHSVGPANPLYLAPTGWTASMVCYPYDDLKSWRSIYPEELWLRQMTKVRDGFAQGNAVFARLVEALSGDRKSAAKRELGLFRAIECHFSSVVDQAEFVRARNRFLAAGEGAAKETARSDMLAAARRELATAKRYLPLVRFDSRIGYECSNHYFFLPQDIREKIVGCRAIIDELAGHRQGRKVD